MAPAEVIARFPEVPEPVMVARFTFEDQVKVPIPLVVRTCPFVPVVLG